MKGCSYSKKPMSKLKAVLEMTTICPDTSRKTTPVTNSSSDDGMIQLGPLGSDAMFA